MAINTTLLDFANELVRVLGGAPTEENSRIYRFGWFNQYTNTAFTLIFTLS